MGDRELLELAAKAADMGEGTYCELAGGEAALYFAGTSRGIWSPLTGDGDALRLAVKLGLQIYPDETNDMVAATNNAAYACEKNTPDKLAATRRAITRAAAALGEKK